MKISSRQWAILLVIALVFIIGALVTGNGADEGDNSPSAEYDEVAWCQALTAVSSRSVALDAGFSGDAASELINLDRALNEAIMVAPEGSHSPLARILDLTINVDAELSRADDLSSAISQALRFIDRTRLDEAFDDVDERLTECGLPPLPALG